MLRQPIIQQLASSGRSSSGRAKNGRFIVQAKGQPFSLVATSRSTGTTGKVSLFWRPAVCDRKYSTLVESTTLPVTQQYCSLRFHSKRILTNGGFHRQPIIQSQRWSSDKRNSSAETKPESNDASNKQEMAELDPNTEVPSSSSTAAAATATASPIAQQLEKRIKRVVTDLNLGDQLSVILIVVLTTLILTAPFAIRQMKSSDTVDYEVTSEDPVDDLTTTFRRAWKEDEEDGKGALEYVLKETLKSKGLQQAAQQFAVTILESPDVQAALQRLVKRLWSDLVEDPETVAQVVRLLQIAIQDPVVKDAALKLVVQLVEDPQVKASLIAMIQQLGVQPPVLDATQTLLTEAAHNTLNDPEILDHSMEFATDVVGDDLVQRTAGEALRKSVGHAVRPATSVFLTAAGVGLLIFGVVAIGYARSSDQEAVLFETAARSLQTNVTYGLVRMATWPGRAVRMCWSHAKVIVLTPLGWIQSGVVLLGKKTAESASEAVLFIVSLPGRGLSLALQTVLSTGRAAAKSISASASSLNHAFVTTVAAFLQQTMDQIIGALQNLFHASSSVMTRAAHSVTKKSSRALAAADQKVLDFYDRLLAMIESILQQLRSSADRFTSR